MTEILNITADLVGKISDLLRNAKNKILNTVNQTMVLTYYEIGRMIVEDEQNGNERAEYGKGLLKKLSVQLTKEFGKGFSVENLDRMRYFYKTYSPRISATLLRKSEQPVSEPFSLSWSHYFKLISVLLSKTDVLPFANT